MNLLLKNNGGRGRKPNFVIFVVWSALSVDGWVGVGLGKEFCLEPAEISPWCSWFNSRMGHAG